MAHLHESAMQAMHLHEPTVIEERDESSTAIVAIFLVIAAVFLVWLFAISGWIVDRNEAPADGTRIEQQIDTEPTGNTQSGPAPQPS